MIWIILGVICLIGAAILTFIIKEATLGKNSTRLLAVVFATIGYFFLHRRLAFLDIGPVAFWWQKYVVLGLFIIAALLCTYGIYKNPEEEFKSVIKSSAHILAIVILCFLARIFFSL